VATSEETKRLLNSFLTGNIDIDARPSDVIHLFPSLHKYPTDLVRSWHNRVRKKARTTLEKMAGNQHTKRGNGG
jgi:hypothetical protein